MAKHMPVIALLYDFDRTLCTKNMQEYGFISSVGCSPNEFWSEADRMASELKMDRILAYMYLMIHKSMSACRPIRRKDFVSLGKQVRFFPGVTEFFSRIREYGTSVGAKVEHYILSSGLREIIEGSPIANEFREIYACEFHYNENGVADWPKSVVNYTTKTQFLFRINKGVLDVSDDDSLNRYQNEDDRPVPFRNMIYIGDGLTDVPCMKLVRVNGGHSIAVYPGAEPGLCRELLTDGRVDFLCSANYRAGGELDRLVKSIIDRAVAEDCLYQKNREQIKRNRI